MPIDFHELFDALIELSRIKNLKATGISSVKAGLVVGVATALGGLLLGRLGLLLGGAIGAGSATALADDFKPVWIILRDLPPTKRKMLLDKVVNAFQNIGIEDVASVAMLLLSKSSLQEVAMRELSNFLRNECNLRLM